MAISCQHEYLESQREYLPEGNAPLHSIIQQPCNFYLQNVPDFLRQQSWATTELWRKEFNYSLEDIVDTIARHF